MQLSSVRDLKLELAVEVFAPIADRLLGNALAPTLSVRRTPTPLQRLALGIAKGQQPGEFSLAVRLQSRSAVTRKFLDLVRAKVPSEIDVNFVGRVSALDDPEPSTAVLRGLCRPMVIGCSVAHIAATAGTLGLIARHRKTARTVLVSNSHVLAQAGLAKPGDAITQPGRVDGGAQNDHVAALLDFTTLKTVGSNYVDAAIAVLDDSIAFEAGKVPGIGPFTQPNGAPLVPGEKVMKVGRTTGLTHGEITVTELDDIVVDYEGIGTAVLDDQIEIKGLPGAPFSKPGDSGSLVIAENLQAVGLLFSGNPLANDGAGVSYANPLLKVTTTLDFTVL
jgi:hypothetical protein